jgi:hypothetical protein
MEALGHVGVVLAPLAFKDGEGALEEQLGLAVLPLRRVQHRQAGETLGDVGVILA